MAAEKNTETLNLSKQDLLELIKEARRPSELEARREQRELQKELEEDARREEQRKQMIEMARQEIAVREATQRNCSHTREDKTPSIVGQAHSDRLIHPLCLRCGLLFDPIPATEQHILEGVTFLRVPPLPKRLTERVVA